MIDIVKELLSRSSDQDGIGWTPTTVVHVPAGLLHRAADRIAQLEAEADEQVQWLKDLADLQIKAEARIAQLEAALRPLACTCKAKHQADCSRSEVDCPFWNARAALEGRT